MMLFEVGVRMERTLENGCQAKVLEQYVIDALSFTEAETRIISEVGAYGTDIDVATIKRSRCTELIGDGSKEKWFKAKVNYITLDVRRRKLQTTISSMPILSQGQRAPSMISSEELSSITALPPSMRQRFWMCSATI